MHKREQSKQELETEVAALRRQLRAAEARRMRGGRGGIGMPIFRSSWIFFPK